MHRRPRLSLAVLLALFVCPALFAGKGGGHGGGAGHGGGHVSGAGSSGHSSGHTIGHSLGHFFGHRSNGLGRKPDGGFVTAGFPHLGARRRVRLRNRFFNTGYCDSFRFSWRNFLFPGEFDCYGGAFFSDPFFYGGSPGTYFWSDSLATSGGYGGSAETADASDLSPDYPDKPESLGPSLWNVQEPVALLRLLDGSTYGLLRYWVEGTRLHYVTSYGGENSVPLEGIDFVGTQELNASSGKRFDLLEDCHKP